MSEDLTTYQNSDGHWISEQEHRRIVAEKDREIESRDLVIDQQARQIARLENGLGCSRSHPHEDMSQVCELKTEIARLKNEMSHWTFVRFKQLEEENAMLREALQGILEIGKRDMTNPKYDGYFEQAQQALKESYSERKKNG